MQTAGLYLRVSTEDQAQQYGLASQERACLDYCKTNKLEVIDTFTDAQTGQTDQRPGIQSALTAAREGKFGHLVLYDATRLGRNVEVSQGLRRELEEAGVTLHFTISGAHDPNSETGVLMGALGDAMSQVEVMRMVRRMSAGRRRSAESGNVPLGGKIPYGFERAKTKTGSTLATVKAEAKIVKQIFKGWIGGKSSTAMAEDLNKRKILRHEPTPWTAQNVLGILHAEIYVGRWFYGKTRTRNGKRVELPREDWILVEVPRIVTDKTWSLAQAKSKSEARKHEGNVKHNYLLRRRIVCNSCGAGYWGRAIRNHNVKKSTSKTVWFYYEHNPEHAKTCKNPTKRIPRHTLEDAVKDELFGWIIDLDGSWEDYQLKQDETEAEIEKKINKRVKALKKLALKVKRAENYLVDGTLTKAAYNDQIIRLSEDGDRLKAELEEYRELQKPLDYERMGPARQMAHEEMQAAKEMGPDYFSEDQWFENIDELNTKIKVMHKKVEIWSEIGKKSLPVVNLQS